MLNLYHEMQPSPLHIVLCMAPNASCVVFGVQNGHITASLAQNTKCAQSPPPPPPPLFGGGGGGGGGVPPGD